MTEKQWLACEDPEQMLNGLQGRTSDRKRRLLGCALVRHVWSLLNEAPPEAVTAAETFADTSRTKVALRRARQDVRARRYKLSVTEAATHAHWVGYWLAEVVATEKAFSSVVGELCRLRPAVFETTDDARWRAVPRVVREVFGFAFSPIPFDFALRSPSSISVAQAAYETRVDPSGELDTTRLAVLADALEDEGCAVAHVLSHLRSPGPHVRGCWALDLILGKS